MDSENSPLFSAKYKLDDAMLSEATGLMTYGRDRVLLGGGIIIVAAACALFVANAGSLMLFLILAFIAVLFASSITSGWGNIQTNRLAKAGFVVSGATDEQLKRHVEFYDDHVDSTAFGHTEAYRYDEVEKLRIGQGVCLVHFEKERFVLIPLSVMSATRYRELGSFLKEKVPPKALR